MREDKLKTSKLEDDYIAKIPNSGFRENRRFRRRFQRLMKNRKVLKAEQEMIKFQKFSTICAFTVAPVSDVSEEAGLVRLFLMMTQEAWRFFLKIGSLIAQYVNKFGKYVMKHPYFTMYTVFLSCSLLLLNHLANKFGRKVKWHNRLLLLVLALSAILLLSVAIKTEAFKTINEWIIDVLKQILMKIILAFRSWTSFIDSLIDSYDSDVDLVDKSKPKSLKGEDLKVFVFFSVITALTMRILLHLFKRKLVGEGPLTNEIISIMQLDIDLSDYLPKVGRNS